MKFIKDCVRDILLYVEEHSIYEKNNIGQNHLHIVSFDELCRADTVKHENDIINYALEKMEEYNLIKFNNNKNHSNIDKCFTNYHISEITSQGHELLDNIKNPDCWNKLKNAIECAGIDDCSLNMYLEYIYSEIRNSLNV